MSAEAMGWTYRHSPYRGAKFDVHLAVADSVNDQHGNDLWITQRRLAEKARVSRDAANKAMRRLVADGFLELLEDNADRGRANRYRFVFKDDAEVVYDSRSVPKVAQGVVGDDTPQGDGEKGGADVADTPVDEDDTVTAEGVQSQTTGVQSSTTPGVVDDYTEPKRTQAGTQRSATPRPAATSRGDDPPVPIVVIDAQGGETTVDVDPGDGPASFDAWWQAYPRHPSTNALGGGGSRKVARDRWLKLSVARRRAALVAIGNYRAHLAVSGYPPVYAEKWLSQRRWEDFADPPAEGADGLDPLAIAIAEACGLDLELVTGELRVQLVTAAAALGRVDATAELVPKVAKRARDKWPDVELGPLGLARHWARFAAGLTAKTAGAVCPSCGQPKRPHDDELCRILQEAA